ncbi:substrate-binding domain-containing protein [Shewanella sp. VB17]|uniref:substrate-binding domain-containing protein n=1 Tax=Shewanella sp. VB17 TaxID=2739432 RepID=UPI001565090D|nr:substrate-binding domain-containing protein [Shewanella sp. VB17]NRD72879.1 substrate-binding domain-containing protein [Shewanella sp. VB17]
MNYIKKIYTVSIILASLGNVSVAMAETKNTVYLYGAGGPHHAIKDVANAFTQEAGNENIKIEVIPGPVTRWEACAQGKEIGCEEKKADIIWGTAEHVILDLISTFEPLGFDSSKVEPIYLRPAVILVQKGNPLKITGIDDLIHNDQVKKIVVNNQTRQSLTSGTAIWEDIAGRLGKLEDIKLFRNKIISQAPGSGAAFKAFKGIDANGKATSQGHADAWISWPEWQINNSNEADLVEIEAERRIYRDLNLVIRNDAENAAKKFYRYLSSDKANIIFQSHGFTK